MAILKTGFLGNASGKLGNVVFAKWNGVETVRTYVEHINDANTPAQQTQRLRMSALQAFLSPLNSSFIKLFNYKAGKKTSPWSYAIKQNMQAVLQDGDIDLSKVCFGKQNIPAVKIISAVYDPYIDLLKIVYSLPGTFSNKSKFPLIATSILGMSDYDDQPFEVNTENIVCFANPQQFLCRIPGANDDRYYNNYFNHGIFIMILASDNWSDEVDGTNAPIPPTSIPTPFTPIPIVANFNKDYTFNPVPKEAFTLSYEVVGVDNTLKIELDELLMSPLIDDTYEISYSLCIIYKQNTIYVDPIVKVISDFPFNVVLTDASDIVSILMLYCVLNPYHTQCSKFNNVDFLENLAGDPQAYVETLVKNYAVNPVSFKISPTAADLTLDLNYMLADFIKSYENGYVTGTPTAFPYEDLAVYISDENLIPVSTNMLTEAGIFYAYDLIPSVNYFLTIFLDSDFLAIYRKPASKQFSQIFAGKYSPIPSIANKSYCSPETIVYLANQEPLSEKIKNEILPMYHFRSDWNFVQESFVTEALKKFQTSNPNKYKKTYMIDKIPCLDCTL